MEELKLISFRKDLIAPERKHEDDAGIDCYALDDFSLCAGDVVIIPLGFGLVIPKNNQIELRPRSSINAMGVITQLGTIDSGYRGEIKAVFVNPTRFDRYFKRGDRICQLVMTPITPCTICREITLNPEDVEKTERGSGGFGSTGK